MDPQLFGPLHYVSGLAFRVAGAGPMLLLVHGGSGSRTHWTRNVDALASRFRVVTMDLPGFGESATPAADMTLESYLDWVADAIQRFTNGEPFDMVGFSFGGAVTGAVSALLAQRACKPARLTLVSPAGFGKPEGRTIKLEKADKGPGQDGQQLRLVTARNLGRWMLAREPLPEDEAVDIQLQNIAHTRFDSRRVSHRETLLADLQESGSSLQFLLGAADPLIWPSPQERKAVINAAFPSARVQIVDGAGHWLQYEASATVNHALLNFHSQEH